MDSSKKLRLFLTLMVPSTMLAASILATDGDIRKLLLPAFGQAAEAHRGSGAVNSFHHNLFFY